MSWKELESICAEHFAMFICGSVCKDYSTMGLQKGLNGTYVLLAAIMLAMIKKLRPAALLHECTVRFPAQLFEEVLNEYVDHHAELQCKNFGAPVRRARAYDLVVHKRFILENGLADLAKLSCKCFLNCSVFLQAPEEEVAMYKKHLALNAMKSASDTAFRDLLPASAFANLGYLLSRPWIQSWMNGSEVAANLDQNAKFQEHAGVHMPCILASVSHMYALKEDRPFIPQD
eukprot:Skav233654  [mRNA]  locus=scaffold2779:909491:910581:+ [translate_table: standard]